MKKIIFVSTLFLYAFAVSAQQRITIPLWHSFSGHLGDTLEALSQQFNAKQSKYRIKPVYKGSYPETLTSFVAAFQAHQHPPIVQIYEIGTATMLQNEQLVKPVYQLMQQYPHKYFKNDNFLTAVRRYYGDQQLNLYAMPFNSSSAVLYYNQSVFAQAGIQAPPKTWQDVVGISKKLLDKKLVKCGFTTTFPSWINIENFYHWHGLSFVKENAQDKHISFDAQPIKFHLKKLKDWQINKVYQYAGRDSNATALFTSGHCAMMIQSSGSYISLKKTSHFSVDVAELPYWPQFRNSGANAVMGGAGLWVINGFSDKTYKGIALFFNFLAHPKTQAFWQLKTGYFPVIQHPITFQDPADISELKASIIAFQQVSHTSDLSPGERLGYYAQIRLFNDEQMEAIISEQQTVEQALALAEKNANNLLAQFKRNSHPALKNL